MNRSTRWLTRFGMSVATAGLIATLVVTTPAAAAPSGALAISTGIDDVCALTALGGVQCWGDNTYGQLGDGTNISRNVPAVIPSLESGVAQISAGRDEVCVLTTAGGVKCWGDNEYGELGDGSINNSSTPVDVVGLESGVAEVSVGTTDACAVTTGGVVECWGYNGDGQLGDGTFTDSSTPVVVNVPGGFSSVSVGQLYACALSNSGGVYCWGYDGEGELGDGGLAVDNSPIRVFGLRAGVKQLSIGPFEACVLTTAGGVKCWGENTYGAVGDGTNTNRDVPTDVLGLTSGIKQISAGLEDACALTNKGAVRCWGYDGFGELGDGGNTDTNSPVDVSGLTKGITQVSAGLATCALTTAHRVRCWGYNGAGELGDGTYTDSNVPTPHTLGFGTTTTVLMLGQAKVKQGATERFTITVSTAGATPTGRADIYIDDLLFNGGPLKNGTLTLKLPLNLSLGSHTVRALYEGKGTLSSSVSAEGTVAIK
jgi:alpha-tubulin suppressor-like RCC1 family protein